MKDRIKQRAILIVACSLFTATIPTFADEAAQPDLTLSDVGPGAFLILLGTLAPLIYDALELGKISVGFPWFNKMFVLITPFLALLMGIGSLSRWKTRFDDEQPQREATRRRAAALPAGESRAAGRPARRRKRWWHLR